MDRTSRTSQTGRSLQSIYDALLSHFCPQHWWPAETPFEVCVGAILTQNTAWSNVEKAIQNLKNAGLMNFESLSSAPIQRIAELIKPAGYFNIKAKRLKSFLEGVKKEFGSFDEMVETSGRLACRQAGTSVRDFLLSIPGIGPETADSMVLYAFGLPSFVVDAYTKRILVRHSLIEEEADYYAIKDYCESHLEPDVAFFNEFHALIVRVGKEFCKKTNPRCEECPLGEMLIQNS